MVETAVKKQSRAGLWFAISLVTLVAVMACAIPMGPYKDFRASQRRLTQLRADERLALDTLAEERRTLQQQEALMQRIRSRVRGFDLGAFMSKVLRDTKLAERSDLKSITPNSRIVENSENLSMVEVGLNGVSLADLVNLLHKVYDSKNLIMLHELKFIRAAQGGKGLDCTMTFVTPKG